MIYIMIKSITSKITLCSVFLLSTDIYFSIFYELKKNGVWIVAEVDLDAVHFCTMVSCHSMNLT